ncbi:MAG: hypothetical protein VX951_08860 [Planctomycetota bacterium]|nr:hypothetical protein [Planctomycetota bacterium]
MNWESKQVARTVEKVRVDASSPDFEQYFLLSSDRHHDNAHADWDLELKHLNQARDRGAGIIDSGDLFCAMQGAWDPRKDRGALREEYQYGNYLDRLVEVATDFYAPYAEHFVVIGKGNHETSIAKRHETDLTERLCQAMTAKAGTTVRAGGYGGWVQFVFRITKTQTQQINLKYWHGSGGGGPVTRGVIRTNRMAVYLPDAHIVVTGHTHDQWVVPIARERIKSNGELLLDEQVHVKCGTYKDEYGDGHGGWHIERGGPPKPVGAQWLRFYRENRCIKFNIERAT